MADRKKPGLRQANELRIDHTEINHHDLADLSSTGYKLEA
jgi:hypothetical protein